MGAAAARLADRIIVTDDNPRSEDPKLIVEQILAGVRLAADSSRLTVEHDRGRAIRTAVAEARDGDVVLVAGKGHETTQTYGSEVRDFSDRAFVSGLLGGRA
jgi:UDP-N-acetylmuramoyl-L-alanyl-D-glutamate--2,6-diaminopimelate ligase